MPLFTFQDIDNIYKKLGITKELAGRFMDRTKKHIQRVFNNAKRINEAYPNRFPKLIDQAFDHDQSKFGSPESLPYIWLTEFYRCKENNLPFQYPDGMEDRTREATLHHIRNNKHHPEFWDSNKNDIKLNKDRDAANQPQVTDATKMDDTSLAEQVADWAAMSQEKGTSLKGWANKTINKRWQFTPDQVKLLYELVEIFEPEKGKGSEAPTQLRGADLRNDPYGVNQTAMNTGYNFKDMTNPSSARMESTVSQDVEIILDGHRFLLEVGDKIIITGKT